jgi:hypothetical protein
MAGPAYYSGTMNISKNEDWIVPFLFGSLNEADQSIQPINLTGSKLLMEIRKREADHEALVSVYSPDGGIQINNPAGAFQIIIRRDQLVNVAPGEYFADLVREMPTGWQERIWEGIAVVVTGTSR